VTVALRFQAAPEHVRTARLVAVAVARRAGMDEVRLDEIRLAVGEVCARAVRRSLQSGKPAGDVLVELDDQGPTLDVVVTDRAGLPAAARRACLRGRPRPDRGALRGRRRGRLRARLVV